MNIIFPSFFIADEEEQPVFNDWPADGGTPVEVVKIVQRVGRNLGLIETADALCGQIVAGIFHIIRGEHHPCFNRICLGLQLETESRRIGQGQGDIINPLANITVRLDFNAVRAANR